MTGKIKKDLRAMQQLVDMAVGKPKYSYQMDRNAPQPKGAFAAIKLTQSTNPGYDKQEYIEDEFGYYFKTTGIRTLEFAIMFSHDDEDIISFDNAFYRPDIKAKAQELGLILMGKRSFTNNDKLFESDWAIRQGIYVTANVIRTQETPITYFNKVIIEGDYNEGEDVTHIGPIKIGDFE